ncbi:MAG: sulfur carrier protein ThiS [Lachnospiraceae bacterium]|nr:sulfur carrier protein ThiS [Lachnospiraceae bacterium]MBQ8666775.1 sulfur carrier protein ThiS [Lachnospiraceae bacterium]
MRITVAGNKKEVKDNLTVAELIAEENVETPQYVTISVNEEFIDSHNFESTLLKEGDEVEFLYFMGGGSHVVY